MSSLNNLQVKIPLNVTIIGAGICGLSTALACSKMGMTVTVFETAHEIAEVGAGLQLGPNMFRILRQWKADDSDQIEAVHLKKHSLRRYDDDSELSTVLLDNAEEIYGAPAMTAHRADVQKSLKKKVEDIGIEIKLGCRVNKIDFQNTRIAIEKCSDWIQSDVIIAADGIKSNARRQILQRHEIQHRLRDTGDAAWRILIPAEEIYKSGDKEVIELLESQMSLRWIGPNAHIVLYPIRNSKFLNVVFIHPWTDETPDLWTKITNKMDITELYKDWNPRVKKLFKFIADGEVIEWHLYDSASLLTWVEGNVALIGDAAHPMLPYIAQGAAQAIEDASVLAICLCMIDNKTQINAALKVYELLRKERVEVIQQSAVDLGETLHLCDRQAQHNRDHSIRNCGKGETNPDLWSDKAFEQWCWGMDVQKHAIDMYESLLKIVANDQKMEKGFNQNKYPWLKTFN